MRNEISHKFFEHGEVRVELVDERTQLASILFCMPAVLLQTISTMLIRVGVVDSFNLHNPLAVWIPPIAQERLKDQFRHIDDFSESIQKDINSEVIRCLELFQCFSQVTEDPTDLLPMIPMGAYVDFKLRCTVDQLAQLVEWMEPVGVQGLDHVRFAIASVLREVLIQLGRSSDRSFEPNLP